MKDIDFIQSQCKYSLNNTECSENAVILVKYHLGGITQDRMLCSEHVHDFIEAIEEEENGYVIDLFLMKKGRIWYSGYKPEKTESNSIPDSEELETAVEIIEEVKFIPTPDKRLNIKKELDKGDELVRLEDAEQSQKDAYLDGIEVGKEIQRGRVVDLIDQRIKELEQEKENPALDTDAVLAQKEELENLRGELNPQNEKTGEVEEDEV